jgi:hypothetical protein
MQQFNYNDPQLVQQNQYLHKLTNIILTAPMLNYIATGYC